MTILSDRDIKKIILENKLLIENVDDLSVQIQPAWIDLRLGDEFGVFERTSTAFIDTKKMPADYTNVINIGNDEPFILHPGEFVLGTTREYIKLPDDIVGYVDGRSSLGRLGIIIHVTSGFIDPGWEGQLVLEITNIGKMPVALYSNMRVCKLVLFQTSSPAEIPYFLRQDAKYKKQKGVQKSKIYKDFKTEEKVLKDFLKKKRKA